MVANTQVYESVNGAISVTEDNNDNEVEDGEDTILIEDLHKTEGTENNKGKKINWMGTSYTKENIDLAISRLTKINKRITVWGWFLLIWSYTISVY